MDPAFQGGVVRQYELRVGPLKVVKEAGVVYGDCCLGCQGLEHFKPVRITIDGGSVEDFQRFRNLLQGLRWVSDVQEKAYDPGESVVTVRYPEKTLYLASRLGRDSTKLLE